MSIDLSICICTFNRGDYIGATLESIVSQATEATEIIIVDGGSADRTAEVVREWQARFPRIRFQVQTKNGGFDRDLTAALDLGRGKYLWMYSDDDPMKPGAIAAVTAQLGRGYSLIVVNAEVRNADLTKVLERNRLRLKSNRVYDDTQALMRDTALYLTFVGGIVLRRDIWASRDKERWFGSMFVHTAIVFGEPLPAPALVIAQPFVIIRYGQARWTPRGFDIWMFRWPDVVWAWPFSDRAKRAVVPREPWRCWTNLLLHRAIGSYSATQYRERLRPRLGPIRRAVSSLIAMLPRRPLNWLLTIAVILILRRRSTTLTDLTNARRR